MKHNVIFESPTHTVASWGHGIAYCVDTPHGTLFVQGDEATRFRTLWDSMEIMDPEMSVEAILDHIVVEEYAIAA